MKLSDCFIGMIVKENKNIAESRQARIGFIVGLALNSLGEVIPYVQWASDKMPYSFESSAVHHANLDQYIDGSN